MDELVSLDAARKAGLVELQRYLDEAGGIASAKHAGAALLLAVLSFIASYSTHRRTRKTTVQQLCQHIIVGGTNIPYHCREALKPRRM